MKFDVTDFKVKATCRFEHIYVTKILSYYCVAIIPKTFFLLCKWNIFEPRIFILKAHTDWRMENYSLYIHVDIYVCLGPRNNSTKQSIELHDTRCLPFLAWFYSSIYVNSNKTVFRKFTGRLSFYHRSPKIRSELNHLRN